LPPPGPAPVRKEVASAPSPATLKLVVNRDAEIYDDKGQLLGEVRADQPIQLTLPAGHHSLRFSSQGQSLRREFTLTADGPVDAVVDF
jgi:hypothetical protein